MCIVILKLKQLFAYLDVRTKRGPQGCVSNQAFPFQENILILSFLMFISIKLEQMINFVLDIRLKRRT